MNYRTMLFASGKTTTGLDVPEAIIEALGAGKRPPVAVTLNGGYTYRTSIGSWEGRPVLPVSAEVRAGAGIAAGDEVEVDITLDTAPRAVTVPKDLASALAGDAAAQTFWDTLSYSNKRRHVLQIDGAKSAETRQRRIDKSLADLRAGKK